MSQWYSSSVSMDEGRELQRCNGAQRGRPENFSGDSAIDSALRAVPLPDGLMTRLGLLVYAMPEESSDQVDWLGC